MKMNKEERKKMYEWFTQIWDERQDSKGYCYCFETGTRMHRSLYRELTTVYHHVLAKQDGAFPQYAMVKKNIVIILPGIHGQVEFNDDFTPKIKAYKEELLALHENDNLKD